MKPVKVLAILCAVIIVTVSGINVLVYSKEAYGAEKVENQMRSISPMGKGSEKSSPLHAWKAIVKLGLDKTGYKIVNNGAGYNHFEHQHLHIMGGSKEEPGGVS